jgi:chromosome partitioning protein
LAGKTTGKANGNTVIYAVAQQKGGVGKTTTAINLAALWARAGRRVLAIDADPQFALTRQLGIELRELELTLADVLSGQARVEQAIVQDVYEIDVLPSSRALSGVEVALAGEMGRERFLTQALEPFAPRYDAIVIDTPPNVGLLTVNALVPADVVVAPVSAEDEGSAQGLAELRAKLHQLPRVRPGSPPRLVVLMTKWRHGRVMGEVIEHAVQELGLVPSGRVPARAIVQQAAVRRAPLAALAVDSAPAVAYHRLAQELEVAA